MLLTVYLYKKKGGSLPDYLCRLAPEIIAYTSPTVNPKASGIQTPKLSILTYICCIRLSNIISHGIKVLSILDFLKNISKKPFIGWVM